MYEAKVQMENPGSVPAETHTTIGPLENMDDEAFKALVRSIMVVIPYRANEGIHPGLCTHFGMWGRIGLRVATVKDTFGGFIEITRGNMVDLFLQHARDNRELKYVVFIDNDEHIEWDAPLRLVSHGLPVVSGIVCSYHPTRGIFACFTAKDENGTPRFPSWQETKLMPNTGLIEAEQVGMGLVAVRRDVIEKVMDEHRAPFMIPEEMRMEAIRTGILPLGEDLVFCDRVRAAG